MSAKLAEKIQLGLDELAVIRGMMSPLIARTEEPGLPVIETAATCKDRNTRCEPRQTRIGSVRVAEFGRAIEYVTLQ